MSKGTNIEINITGDVMIMIKELRVQFEQFKSQVGELTAGVKDGFDKINDKIDETKERLRDTDVGMRLLAANAIRELTGVISQPFIDGAEALYDYDSALREVSAITGVVGPGLDELGGYARAASKAFGGTAASHLKTYQLLLSELTPELANKPAALKEMGDLVSTLALTMGGDTKGAATALNAAMNQFGIDLSDPMEAAKEMRTIMNQMGAAAQAGSVEVPDVATALNQVGSAAKAAGLNFAETNAALQVLGKAGRKGSEGGVALRNVLRIMGKDDFMPKEVAERMELYGVNLKMLADPAVNVREKLMELRKISSDGTLMSGLFGENVIAGRALIENIGLFDEFNTKIVDNATATEDMAEIISGGLEKRKERFMAFFADIRLGLFETLGGFAVAGELAVQGLSGFFSIAPGIMAAHGALKAFTTSTKVQAFWSKLMIPLTAGWSAVTTGLGVAFRFMMGPIGWIITGIGLVAAGVIYAWNKFEGFRAAIFGIWEAVKKVFSNIASFIGDMLGPFFDAIKLMLAGDWKGAATAMGKGLLNVATAQFKFAKAMFTGELTEGVGEAYRQGDAAGRKSFAESKAKDKPLEVEATVSEDIVKTMLDRIEPTTPLKPTDDRKTTVGGSQGGRIVTTNIQQLVGTLNVHVAGGIANFEQRVRDAVNTALIAAVRDSEIATS